MIIATWNIERFKHHKEKESMLQLCSRTEADIMVLSACMRSVVTESLSDEPLMIA